MQQQIDIKQINKKARKWRGLYWVSAIPILAIGITYASAYAYAIGEKEKFSALNYYSDLFSSKELLYFEGSKTLKINKNINDFYKKATTDWGNDGSFFTDIENAVSILDDFGVNPEPTETDSLEAETNETLEWRELKRQISHAVLTFDQLMKSSKNIEDINYWLKLSKDLQKNMKFITYSMPATKIEFNGQTFLSPTISNWTIGRWLNELNYHWDRATWTKYEKMPELLEAFTNVETLELTENNEAKDLIIAYMFYLMSITSPSNQKPVFSSTVHDDEYSFENLMDSKTSLSFTKPLPRMFSDLSTINKSMVDYQMEIKSILEFEKNTSGYFNTLSKLNIFTANTTSKNELSNYFVQIADLTIDIHAKISAWKTQNPGRKLERISFNGEMIISNYDDLLTSNTTYWNNSVNFHNSPIGTPQNKFTVLEDGGYIYYKQLFPTTNNINKNYGHFAIFSALLEQHAFDLKDGEKKYIESHTLNGDAYYGGDPKIINSIFNENISPTVTRAFPMDITNTTYGDELIYTREYFTARNADEMEQKLLRLKSNLRKYKPSSTAVHVSDYYLVDPELENKIIEFNKMVIPTDISSVVTSFQGSSFGIHDPIAGVYGNVSAVQDYVSYLVNTAPVDDKIDIFVTGAASTSRYEWFQTKPADCSDVQWQGANYYVYNGSGSYSKLNSTIPINDTSTPSVPNMLGRNSFSFKNEQGHLFIFGEPEYFNKWIEREYEPNLFNTNSTTYSVYKSETRPNEPTIIAKAYDKSLVSYIPSPSQYLNDVTATNHLIMDNDRIVIDTKPYEIRYSFRTNKYIPTLP